MFKSMKLGTKIVLGFLVVVALVAVAGIAGYWGVARVSNALRVVAEQEAPLADSAMEMSRTIDKAQRLADELATVTAAVTSQDASQIGALDRSFAETTARFDGLARAMQEGGEVSGVKILATDNTEIVALIKQAQETHDGKFSPGFASMKAIGQKLVEAKTAADQTLAAMEKEYGDLVPIAERVETLTGSEVEKGMAAADTMEKAKQVMSSKNPLADCAMESKYAIAQSWMALDDVAQALTEEEIKSASSRYEKGVQDFDAYILAILQGRELNGTRIVPTDNENIRSAAQQIDKGHEPFQQKATTLISKRQDLLTQTRLMSQAMTEFDKAGTELDGLLSKIEGLAGAERDRAREDGAAAKNMATWSLTAIVVASMILGLSIGIFLTRSITKVLNRIVAALTEGAEQVASASGQVSAASQSLAEGATEQAAGLEETSSSLEEMSSMTKQNADNAQQANTLAAEAKKAANTGTESMGRMSQAIHDIQKSSDETAKIIKVIDEIAFQTNLLALNAAVEAARAGEAGKGFAVVAEEVRNLAMRSAEAAKNTARMIEESVKNSKNGVDIATEVGKVLQEIVQSVGKTTDLVSEIAAASQEQAQGIDQVNTAVAQMDKVTQQNAANAEESASASEELNAQAESMKEVVGQLTALVGGATTQQARSGGPKTTEHHLHVNLEHKAPKVEKAVAKAHAFGKSDEAFHKIARPQAKRTPVAKAVGKTIPLDKSEDDLSTFNN